MQKLLIGDFSLGAWEKTGLAARQPAGSVRFAQDAYVDDDGVLRVRGRLTRRSATNLGTAFGTPWTPVFTWAGALLPGFREMFVAYSAALPAYKFTVLDNAGTSYAVAYSVGGANETPDFTAAAVWGNTLVMSPTDPLASLWVYGGSRMNTGATTISSTFVAGSTTVTTAADFVAAGVQVGTLIALPVSGFAVVTKINSTTNITIDRPSTTSTTVAGNIIADFLLTRIGPAAGVAWSGQIESIAGRAVLMQRNQLAFSDGPDPTTGAHRTYSWPAKNLHEFPNDAEGVALKALGDRLFVFTQAGNFAISGMAQEIIDGSGNPQHAIARLAGKSVAMGQSGIVNWQGALIVPCRDGVFAMDGYGSPVLLSRGLPWAEMVRGGLKTGWATIFQGRYMLPVTYQGSTWTYVFRMDGLDTPNGTVFPVSRLALPANPVALASSSSDKLLVLGTPTEGALEGGELFSQTSNATDYNGNCSTDNYNWRSAPLQLGVKAVIRRIRVLYTYRTPTSPNNPSLSVLIEGGAVPVSANFSLPAGAATSEPVWVAADLVQPVEVAAPILNLFLSSSPHSAFAQEFTVHAIEVQYRSFGAP